MRQHVRGVIFDVDGTLINSNDAHARAWVVALAERGIQVSFETVRPLIGMGGDKLLPILAGIEHESELGEQVSARRAAIFRETYLRALHPFPKTRQLLARLRGMGLRLAVASSAAQADLEPLLRLAQVEDLLEGATSAADAPRSKPDPDIVRAALQRLELEPHEAVMVGDTPYDIEAAARLGLQTIALRCGGRSDRELRGASAIYDSPADLLEKLGESPLVHAG